jgi:ribosomal protein L11 methyltransferase
MNEPIDQLEVAEGSIEMLLTLIPQPLDGFVCNILANIIIDLIPQMGELVKPPSLLQNLAYDKIKQSIT